jgi:hypothetical protein
MYNLPNYCWKIDAVILIVQRIGSSSDFQQIGWGSDSMYDKKSERLHRTTRFRVRIHIRFDALEPKKSKHYFFRNRKGKIMFPEYI